MKRVIITITVILFIFIGTTLSVSYILIKKNNIENFNIISVSNVSTKFYITFEKVKSAKEYEINLYNEENVIIFKDKTDNNYLMANLDTIQNNKSYSINVYAYDEKGNCIASNKPYNFTYLEPTFSKENSLTFDEKSDYTLLINGNLQKKVYTLELMFNDKRLKKEIINTNEYIIPKELFIGKKGIFNVKIYDQNTAISEFNIYSNISPISDIVINSPKDNSEVDYEDINLKFDGGNNSTSYELIIYKDENIIKETTINSNNVIISSEFFNKGANYTFKINAKYNDRNDYTKSSEVKFKIKSKDTLKPPYISNNPKYSGDKITLNNPNNSGKIYYTINGSDPNINGIEYKEPFTINNNAVINAIIKSKDNSKNNSKISTFDINIEKKNKYKIYLNFYYDIQNKSLLKSIKENLKSDLEKNNIDVFVNSNNNVNIALNEAKNSQVDLFLSFKTDTYINKDKSGFTIWVNNDTNLGYNFANLLSDKFNSIYYENANKGLKYTFDSLNELNTIDTSALISLGNFENEKDVNFLNNNIKTISETIVKTIKEYFGLL